MEEAWALGQRAIEILQEELGGEAEILLAVEGGGVSGSLRVRLKTIRKPG